MIRIEQATIEEIPQMADLLAILFTEEAEFGVDRERQMRGLQLIVQSPERGSIFIATEEDRVVGMTSLLFTISTAKGSPVCWLEDMIVHPDYRRQGIGTRLLQYAVNYARTHGLSRITLLTDIQSEDSIRFYERHGFKRSEMMPLRLHLS